MARLTRKPTRTPLRKYQHFLETLESRILLAVSAAEFSQIRAMYPDLNLSSNMSAYNVIEVADGQLGNLRSFLSDPSITATGITPNLIVVRTTMHNTLNLSSQLSIYTNASAYGSITIVSLGNLPLTLNCQDNSRAFYISSYANVSLGGLTIRNGMAFRSGDGGGGICNYGTLTATKLTVVDSYAGTGGAIYNGDGASMTIMNSTITRNSVGSITSAYGAYSYTGGGICNWGTLKVINSIIADNEVYARDGTARGGGIFNIGTATVTNSTIVNNTADYMINSGEASGGGVYNSGGSLTLANTIIVGNESGRYLSTSTDDINYGWAGWFDIAGYNNLTTFTEWSSAANNIMYDPAKSLFVGYNDYRLAANAQVIDKGDNSRAALAGLTASSKDLAGNPRIVGGTIDIGAYEYQATLPARLPGDANGDGIVDLADLTILARNWKKPGDWSTGDFNGDGFVDLADLTILARNWKKTIGDMAGVETDGLSWAAALASVTFGSPSPALPIAAPESAAVVTTVPAVSLSGPLPLNWSAPKFNNTFAHAIYRVDSTAKTGTLLWESPTSTAIEDLLAGTKYTFIASTVSAK